MTIITAKGIHDPSSGAAGCAALVFIQSGWEPKTFASPITARGATEAELIAIDAGMADALDAGMLDDMSRVEIRTNCRECVAVLLACVPSTRVIGDVLIEPAKKISGWITRSDVLASIVARQRRHSLALVFRVDMDPEVVARAKQMAASSASVRV